MKCSTNQGTALGKVDTASVDIPNLVAEPQKFAAFVRRHPRLTPWGSPRRLGTSLRNREGAQLRAVQAKASGAVSSTADGCLVKNVGGARKQGDVDERQVSPMWNRENATRCTAFRTSWGQHADRYFRFPEASGVARRRLTPHVGERHPSRCRRLLSTGWKTRITRWPVSTRGGGRCACHFPWWPAPPSGRRRSRSPLCLIPPARTYLGPPSVWASPPSRWASGTPAFCCRTEPSGAGATTTRTSRRRTATRAFDEIPLANVIEIHAVDERTVALTSDGRVYLWGATGDSSNYLQIAVPLSLSGTGVTHVAIGGEDICGVTTGGEVSCWD